MPAKVTDCPGWMFTEEALGLVIVAVGGWLFGCRASRTKLATDGTPFWSATSTRRL